MFRRLKQRRLERKFLSYQLKLFAFSVEKDVFLTPRTIDEIAYHLSHGKPHRHSEDTQKLLTMARVSHDQKYMRGVRVVSDISGVTLGQNGFSVSFDAVNSLTEKLQATEPITEKRG